MNVYPRPQFAHLARALRARMWQRCRPHLAALSAILVCFLVCFFGLAGKAKAEEGRWITVEATAYCPCALCCDERTERTANRTDTNAVPYGIAASPDLPFGTSVRVPVGAGYLDLTYPRESQRSFTVDDRGGALRTEWRRSGITRLDLRYKSHDYAKRFGRKLMLVFISSPL